MSMAFQDNRLDGLWEWHPARDELIVNARWCEIQGLDPDVGPSMKASCWLTSVHPDDRPALERGLGAMLDEGLDHHEIDIRLRQDEERWIWALHRARASDGADGCGAARRVVHGALQDITSRKAQEATLRADGHFLDRIGRVASVGGWEVDLLERRVTWSDETCRLHARPPGYRPTLEEVESYFGPNAREVIRSCVAKAISSGESYDVELPLTRADGRGIVVRVVGSIEYRDGQAVRLSGAIQDVTDRAVRRLVELGDSHRQLERVNERLSLATDSGRIGIWDFDIAAGEFVWDAHMRGLYGLAPDDDEPIDAERWLSFVHPDDRERVVEAACSAIVVGRREELEFRIVPADGEVRELHGTARVVRDENGWAQRMVGTNKDVTEERRTTRELARQHEIIQVTLQSIGDGVITTDTDGRVLWLNPVAESMIGWNEVEARGRRLRDVFHLVDEATRQRVHPIPICFDEGRVTGLDGDTILVARDGTRRWIEESTAPIRNAEGEVFGAVLVFHDVTEQRSAAHEMTWRATHDELTGLVNRAEFEATLERLHAELAGTGDEHALLFIDLDRFKIVNDTCGHAAGDQLLQQVGRLLARTVRADDLLVRLGGDEFAVVLKHCPLDRARDVAQEICDLMDEFRFVHDAQRFRIGASVGLVPITADWDDAAAIARAADTACYAAKESGRNRVHAWSETDKAMHERRAQTRWATRLETALDDGGFELYAQRIGALGALPRGFDGRSSGRAGGTPLEGAPDGHAEVLVRLRGEDGQLVLPGAFLPAAERFDLIDRVDRWVLGEVIGWLSSHRDRPDLGTLWVNLSGQSFGDLRFQRDTLERLGAAGRQVCGSLCLEITETAAVTNLDQAARFITELRALGVRIALDDFGAGASSFGYLKSLPVNYLKIDGQFVRDLTDDALDAAAVRCFAEVARIMNVETVAEFVETPDVLEYLREIGIDFVQGWLLHEPAPIEALLHEGGAFAVERAV